MDKVKVSKDIAHALDLGIKICGKEQLLNDHVKCKIWTSYVCFPLNKLSTLELAEILIKGYEVEETPEEIVEKVFNNLPDSEKNVYYKSGILFTLNTYGIKIKGIND